MPRPTIKTRCTAQNYAGPDERIAEITLPDGRGCLLSVTADGRIELYRADCLMTFNGRTPRGPEAFQVDGATLMLGGPRA